MSKETRAVGIALLSTVVLLAVITIVITRSPGWGTFKEFFLDPTIYRDSFAEIATAFKLNVKIFLIAEAIILPAALLLAVLRSLPGPVFFPIRALAVVYADLFRGIPTILVIGMLGFGMPSLEIAWIPKTSVFWGIGTLVLVYTAYVTEV